MVRRNECLNMVESNWNFEQGRSVCIPATLKLTRSLFNDTLEACCTLAITSNGSDFLKQLFLVIVKIFQY
jgi:hypothetical protein